jgi:hypothetical protein
MYDARIRKTEIDSGFLILKLNVSVKRIITGSAIKLVAALGGTALLFYIASFLPGLFLIFLPGFVTLGGKVYDEAKLIQFLRYGEPISTERWDDTETCREMIRIKTAESCGTSMTF